MTDQVPPTPEPLSQPEPIQPMPTTWASQPLPPVAAEPVPGMAPQPPARPVGRVPIWLLPVVAALALVLGILGGAVGGVLATRDS
ncbi:MAG TPA: hypothetical protein PKM12_05220, partial [Marmoricola sp.]|nr:hypothetical protein [Marmoricola sp.]